VKTAGTVQHFGAFGSSTPSANNAKGNKHINANNIFFILILLF